ncbi:hypothetical protein LQZ18_02620 [Lachnospiraceae bacterium ZAX-1]
MAYLAKDAANTLFGYLGLTPKEITYIEKTNNRGFLYETTNGEKCVIFIYPISHKADDSKNFFDTRDSGAYERGVAWNYAIENKLKYFCLAVHDQVKKYNNYIFSLECNENRIAEVAGTVNGTRSGSGTQVVIPNNYVPTKGFDRIFTKNSFYIAVIKKDFLHDYLDKYDNRPYMVDDTPVEMEGFIEITPDEQKVEFKTGLESKFCRNRILFGAPGTGKSFTLNEERKDLLGNDSDIDYERVTFHPDYSYANFVGTYKPVMVKAENWVSKSTGKENVLAILLDESKTAQEKYDLLYDTFKDGDLTRLPLLLGLYSDDSFTTRKKDGTTAVGDNSVERNHGKAIRPYVNLIDETISANEISYEYVPGPFMRVYVEALKNARTDNPKPFLLIIEEINRANVAAVFGDIFQLLDRGDDEVSEYPIQASEDIKKFLARELGGEPEQYNKIKIPDNMFIWATMNSADQGVFPMDTAFKRRWDFTYLGIDDSEKDLIGKTVVLGEGKTKHQVEWNKLRKAINKFLAKNKINEDKQLGPYFISKKIVVPSSGDEIERDAFINTFKHKVIMYLFEDAAKQKRSTFFEGCFDGSSRYSEICKEFDLKGIGIFNSEIQTAAEPMDLLDAVEESTVEENAE